MIRLLSALVSPGAEAAMEWVLTHMEDPDFNTPEAASAGKQGIHVYARLR